MRIEIVAHSRVRSYWNGTGVIYEMAKRPQNICKNCDHTWYPKGHNLSQKCPECGSQNVRINRNESTLLIAVLGAITFLVSLSDLLFDKTRDWNFSNNRILDLVIAGIGLALGLTLRKFLVGKKE